MILCSSGCCNRLPLPHFFIPFGSKTCAKLLLRAWNLASNDCNDCTKQRRISERLLRLAKASKVNCLCDAAVNRPAATSVSWGNLVEDAETDFRPLFNQLFEAYGKPSNAEDNAEDADSDLPKDSWEENHQDTFPLLWLCDLSLGAVEAKVT